MPVEFLHETGDNSKDYKLLMAYDGSGRRISKSRYSKDDQKGYWYLDNVTHYTGIGTEVREKILDKKTQVVVNMPQGLGRYQPEDAEKVDGTQIPVDGNGNPVFMGEATPEFEWYLKNHLGSTMLVYGTQPYNDKYSGYAGGVKAAYDYRAFGEQVSLAEPADKVTENFTGKEKDDETELSNHGARMLDPMLGMWISVDPKRFFPSPYLYMGNGYNPILSIDTTGNTPAELAVTTAIAAPSALYNMYQVQDKLAERGASWLEMSAKGAAVLFTSLLINAIVPGSQNPLIAGFLGATTAAGTDVITQKIILQNDVIDLMELGDEARNGFLIGTMTASANTAASTQFLEPTSSFIGDAAGVATEFLIQKCKDE